MNKSIFVGDTDYSRQSLVDMLTDLSTLIRDLSISLPSISHSKNEMQSDYWEQTVSYDLQRYLERAQQLCETSSDELIDIRRDINSKIEAHHISRLRRLAGEAVSIHQEIAKAWGSKYYVHENPNFDFLERVYIETMDLVADLIDLGALSDRLQDFVGRENTQVLLQLTTVLEDTLREICNMPNNFVYAQGDIQENPFRDFVLVVLRGMGYQATAEPQRRAARPEDDRGNEGRIDILVESDGGAEAIIEFKIWPRNDYQEIIAQVLGYGTPWTTEYATVMINQNRNSILEGFREVIENSPYFIDFLEVEQEYQPLQKVVSIHHKEIAGTNRARDFYIFNFIVNLSLFRNG